MNLSKTTLYVTRRSNWTSLLNVLSRKILVHNIIPNLNNCTNFYIPAFYTREVKVKFSLEQATKAQRESRCIALLFLQPRRYMWVGSQRHAPAALPPEKLDTHCIGGWVCPRAGDTTEV